MRLHRQPDTSQNRSEQAWRLKEGTDRQQALTEVAEAQDVDEGVHMALRGEVDARADMAQRGVDVLRVGGAQPMQGLPVLLYLIVIPRCLLCPQHTCTHATVGICDLQQDFSKIGLACTGF